MTHNLNPQQKSASEAPSAPLLIVAGAGTGKTRTLVSRLTHFIERGTPPQRICAITFTNKAAREMANRITNYQLLITNNQLPFIGTFHALGAKILRQNAKLLGRGINFAIFDDHDSFGLIKKIIKRRLGASRKSSREDDRRSLKDLERPAFFAQKISEIKNTNSAITNLKKLGEETEELIIRVFREYENSLEENNAFDFDDLIEKPVYLFKKRPEVLKKYQNKFDAILVDEYQDLNPKQYEFVKFLAGNHKNLSVVGDDEQLIYGWRYADLATFFNFERDWPGAQIKFLEENYRSTRNIIGAASAVAKNNKYRRPKNLWTGNPAGELIQVVEVRDENEEAEWMAKKISNFQFSIFKQETTAVLYRTNAQSRAIEQALIRHKIPYRIFGGLKFYERKEIKDIVAALRYATNRKDEMSRERLEKNIGKRKFQEFAEAVSSPNIKNLSPVKLVERFLKTTDYLEYLERNSLNYDERRENIAELVDFAYGFDELTRFLEEIALVQATDLPSAGTMTIINDNNEENVNSYGQVVHLSTIHLAKGLEFDRVFIAGCSEGLLPHARSLENVYQLEEERRLMYVAMTRARKILCISFYDLPSRFLGEIPEEHVELRSSQGARDSSSSLREEDEYVSID